MCCRGWHSGSMHLTVSQTSEGSIPSLGTVHGFGFKIKTYSNGRIIKTKEKRNNTRGHGHRYLARLFLSVLCNSVFYMLYVICFKNFICEPKLLYGTINIYGCVHQKSPAVPATFFEFDETFTANRACYSDHFGIR